MTVCTVLAAGSSPSPPSSSKLKLVEPTAYGHSVTLPHASEEGVLVGEGFPAAAEVMRASDSVSKRSSGEGEEDIDAGDAWFREGDDRFQLNEFIMRCV
jgi:hypothetical protein